MGRCGPRRASVVAMESGVGGRGVGRCGPRRASVVAMESGAGGRGVGLGGSRRAGVVAMESGVGGVVLGSGARGSMETSPRPIVDHRPAARAVGAEPRLKGFGGMMGAFDS